jgi:RNA-directed DNA polymerase
MWHRSNQARHKIKAKYMPWNRVYNYEGVTHQSNWTLNGQMQGKHGLISRNFLPSHTWVHKKKHVKVKGDASPYDGNLMYWILRLKNYTYHNQRLSKLIRRQNGICPYCGTRFLHTEATLPEIDHKIPRSQKGTNRFDNLQALHVDCHREKTAKERGNAPGNNCDPSAAKAALSARHDRSRLLPKLCKPRASSAG